jgi:hypothetical protein
MNLLYVPILAAKRGEFTALTNLPSAASSRIMPLFDLPNPADGKPLENRIVKVATKTGAAWANREAFLDIAKWKPNARTESGIHVLEFAFSHFRSQGVIAHPVVAYDRWDDHEYSQALKNIRSMYPVTPCIRLDREALEDMGDLTYFSERIDLIMAELSVSPTNCYVLIDLGDISKSAVPHVLADVESAIDTVRSLGFNMIILAGSSMPASINVAVATPDAVGCIPRIEMMAWKALFEDRKDRRIVFGDYAVRNPSAPDGVIAPHANAKIRYTINNQFFIVRGHSKQKTRLALQNKELAKTLVSSHHYMGPTFSWGDAQILECSIGTKEMGDATGWIAIDSNHHIQTVVAEVFEFQHQFAPLGVATLGKP